MKKLILLLTVLNACSIQAQIPNPGFEQLDASGKIRNWIFPGLIPISLNDSIVYDGFSFSKSTDARTGLYALELRNSYNYTSGTPFMNGSVAATLPDTTMYIGFTRLVPLNYKPSALEFYYKFSQNPLNDSLSAEVNIFNSDEIIIGTGRIAVTGPPTAYQKATVYLSYPLVIAGTSNLLPAFASIDFKNKPLWNILQVGQRSLVDDVSFAPNTTGITEQSTSKMPAVSPIPVTDKLLIAEDGWSSELSSIEGTVLLKSDARELDVTGLCKGIYFLKLTNGSRTYSQKIIKE